MSNALVFSPEAEEQLAELYRYIAAAASPDVAARYTEAIVTYCEGLRTFPLRGTIEDVLEPFLIQQGYLLRTPRGRTATRLAYAHFDRPMAADAPAAAQGDLPLGGGDDESVSPPSEPLMGNDGEKPRTLVLWPGHKHAKRLH